MAITKTKSNRQRTRKALILVSFLLFPITMNYLSPYVIIDGASQGIVNGSLIAFSLMFAGSMFFGRLFCGWICPAGGLQELWLPVNDRRVNGKKVDWIKWAVWIPWILLIAWIAYSAGGYKAIDPLLDTVGGISVAGDADRPILFAYVIYYGVVGLFSILAVAAGRRGGCHTICWMAPFMILGRKIRNLAGWPALRLSANANLCSDCLTCTTNCPMSLDVHGMVKIEQMENSECILCGSCVDGCSKRAIRYRFSAGNQ